MKCPARIPAHTQVLNRCMTTDILLMEMELMVDTAGTVNMMDSILRQTRDITALPKTHIISTNILSPRDRSLLNMANLP